MGTARPGADHLAAVPLRRGRSLHEDPAIWGHFVIACQEPGCESVWLDPPHEQAC